MPSPTGPAKGVSTSSAAWSTGDTPSTKGAVEILAELSERKHVLVVVERKDTVTWKSLRNVVGVHLLVPDQLNTYDVLVSDDVVFTRGAFDAFVSGPVKGKSVKAVATSAEATGPAADTASETGADEQEGSEQ